MVVDIEQLSFEQLQQIEADLKMRMQRLDQLYTGTVMVMMVMVTFR